MHDARGPMPGMEVDVSKEGGGKGREGTSVLRTRLPTRRNRQHKDGVQIWWKSYLMKDVLGKPVGRVQFFLNEILADLLDEGKVLNVKG